MSDTFLAVDWGTTNRRVYLIENEAVIRTERDGKGAASVKAADYPAEVAAIRARFGDWPMLLAGMVGSTIGWRAVPYATVPAGFAALAAGLDRIDARTAIIPGLAQHDPADVMRGEEVQLLGAVAAGLVGPDALLCQPGTHCKWARMRGGEIAGFATAMTGELFALLRGHSILAPALASTPVDGAAFRAGVADGAARGAAASLFGIRARAVLGEESDGASFASGALIGADVAHHLGDGPIHVLADENLGALYVAAAETLGGDARLIDSHTAFIAGINRIRELSR